jgi:hypothetical protein
MAQVFPFLERGGPQPRTFPVHSTQLLRSGPPYLELAVNLEDAQGFVKVFPRDDAAGAAPIPPE